MGSQVDKISKFSKAIEAETKEQNDQIIKIINETVKREIMLTVNKI